MSRPHPHQPAKAAAPGSPGQGLHLRDDGDTVVPQRVLEDVVEPVVETMGYELVHLEWTQSGHHRKLVVYLDRPGGPGAIDLDDCARMSPIIGNALEAAEADPEGSPRLRELLAGPYTLEVSSPGLERPLGRRSHFERFSGQRATVRTLVPVVAGSNQRTFHGRIGAVQADPTAPEDDRCGFVEVISDEGATFRIPMAQIRRANLIYEG